MKGSLISLVLTTLLVINSIFQPHQDNNLVAADSTYGNILSTSHNNTYEGANRCTGLQCGVVVEDDADLYMDQQAAVRSSRMLAGNNNQVTSGTSNQNNPTCSSGGSYTSSSCLGSSQVSHCNNYCGARSG
ncbi:hypothetical protein TSUD_169990 [Trifolium subterraneum]|uniref:Rapid ALkalinization Factor n=1 Tax=Trifolium subterraneum TaxID=3900 RepID=A0A2Z6NB02_TRISU|nr:hypothetical protein TSUD_169990 [Trifolium subterraneum]